MRTDEESGRSDIDGLAKVLLKKQKKVTFELYGLMKDLYFYVTKSSSDVTSTVNLAFSTITNISDSAYIAAKLSIIETEEGQLKFYAIFQLKNNLI